jgi:hypothetical protein
LQHDILFELTMKFQIQLADVLKPLAGARMRRGTISAGYSQVMPSQPMAKKVLKTKRKTTPAIWKAGWSREFTPVRMAMVAAWPAAPKSMSFRRPTRSTSQMGGIDARKYSVPLRAASRRARKEDMPSWWTC